MAEEKRLLHLQINPAKSKYPPPEPLPTTPYPSSRNSPERGKYESNMSHFHK